MKRYAFVTMILVVGGCWGNGETETGELVGEFEVGGALVEQTCGDAMDGSDRIEIEFALSTDADATGRAYMDSSGSVFVGTVDYDEYEFQVSQSWTVSQSSTGYEGCYVTQHDVFYVLVETPDDATARTISGYQMTEIEPIAGSDCSSALSVSGGAFLALPCRVEYVLSGDEIL